VQWALELGVAGGLFTTKARRKHDD
jgi:hypothetical protein